MYSAVWECDMMSRDKLSQGRVYWGILPRNGLIHTIRTANADAGGWREIAGVSIH